MEMTHLSRILRTSTEPYSTAICRALLKTIGTSPRPKEDELSDEQELMLELRGEHGLVESTGSSLKQIIKITLKFKV